MLVVPVRQVKLAARKRRRLRQILKIVKGFWS